ncbi:gas vesicle protein [Kitasatospora sp. NPDC127111]|uniref:gas vesicle protein n=1 Tax=Kitasatospora sp. NPDC127111 TaxID=3345363 RepID=UPI003641083D
MSYPVEPSTVLQQRNVALVDLLDRVLAGGVVIAGEITLSIADVDLVRISLRALIASVRSATAAPDGALP